MTSRTGEGGGEESPAWVVEVNKAVRRGYRKDSVSGWSIYRVPEGLREAQESAFIPKLVSIGPFHSKDRKLKAMNEWKMRTLERLLARDFNNSRKLDILTKEMKLLEQKARTCYSEDFSDIPSDEFVRMMVVDGCFVIELLRQHHLSVKQNQRHEDSIFFSHCKLRTIQRDLLLLENQLPYFVLEKLFDLTIVDERKQFLHTSMDGGVNGGQRQDSSPLLNDNARSCQGSSEDQKPESTGNCKYSKEKKVQISMNKEPGSKGGVRSFEELVIDFFEPLVLPKRSLSCKMGEVKYQQYQHHLLDVFRHTFIIQIKEKLGEGSISWETVVINPKDRCKNPPNQEKYKQLMYPAMELEESGVSIRKKMVTPDFDFLRIEFKEDGTLIIPPLYLDDYTVPMFLNFLAFEQCKGTEEPYFSNYFMFWDGLMDTEADVEILHRERVINHFFGSGKDVVTLLNKVGREITYDQNHCYLHKEMKALNIYCDQYHASTLQKWWRKLLRDYFSSPWTFLSLVAAVLLLVLTFLQTFYTIYAFHRQMRDDAAKGGDPQN